MPFEKRKSRILVVRLSDEDYRTLQMRCRALGFRTLSEYARHSMLEFNARPSEPLSASAEKLIESLSTSLQLLDAKITELNRLGSPDSTDSKAAAAAQGSGK